MLAEMADAAKQPLTFGLFRYLTPQEADYCPAPLRVIALIEDPAVIERILRWLSLWEPILASGARRAREPAVHLPPGA